MKRERDWKIRYNVIGENLNLDDIKKSDLCYMAPEKVCEYYNEKFKQVEDYLAARSSNKFGMKQWVPGKLQIVIQNGMIGFVPKARSSK